MNSPAPSSNSRGLAWWGWAVLTWIVAFLTLALAGLLWMSGSPKEEALRSGQRIEVSLIDGTVTGRRVPLGKPSRSAEADQGAGKSPETPDSGDGASTATPEEAGAPPLTLAPLNEALLEKSPAGNLPKIGEDGTLPWKTYARPFDDASGRPVVAILITDLGPMRASFDKALALPGEISLGLSPYTANPEQLAESARARGHEIFTILPLEPPDFPASDPGPKGLLKVYGVQENTDRLRWVLSRYPASVGVLTPVAENFSHDPQSIKPILSELIDRGLLTIAGNTGNDSYFAHLSAPESSHVLPFDTVIDDALTPEAIVQKLSDLETTAKAKGFAIGLAHPYPVTLTALEGWAKTLAEKGFVLAPVTAVATRRQ